MGELGQEEEACQLLLQQIQNHKAGGAHISCEFAMTLGKFGQVEQARQLLLTKAQDPEDFAEHRIDAAGCLGELGYMDEASQLLINLASDRQIDNKFRYQAGRTLWLKLGQVEQAKQVFLNLLKTRQFDNETRDDIIDSLRESGQIEDESVVQIVITELLQLLSDNQLHEYTRCKVAYDLGRLGRGNKLIFKKLFRMASDDQVHNRVRCGAYQGLREFLELKSSDIFTCPHQ
jgi:tetratricopeptide (TPR) repeat protein